MKTLVTGSRGVLGTHYCSRYGGLPFADSNGLVDICDSARVRSAIATMRPEAVLHLAAQSSVALSFEDPASTFAVNFSGTFHLLEALDEAGFEGIFLYAGSADVYGKTDEADLPTKESQPLRPRSPYAVSKVAAEALCYQWSQTAKFRIVIVRPFNQIGPGQRSRFAIAQFARQINDIRLQRQSPSLVTGDLDVTRDFTDVRDAVRAFRLLLERGVNGEVYNLCSGEERSLRSLLDRMLQLAGIDAQVRVDPALLRPNEQRRMVGSPSKIRNLIGWEPSISMDTTLTDMLQELQVNE
jgi:GDP-4-dehydro-6-deoxy-D-mannose reductase